MIANNIKKLIIGLSCGVMLLVGAGISTAQAQSRVVIRQRPIFVTRPYWGYRSFWGPGWGRTYYVADPIALQRESGYSDGLSRGKDDAKHGKPDAPASHKHYSDSHSLTYREAFLQGYADGYREQMDRRG